MDVFSELKQKSSLKRGFFVPREGVEPTTYALGEHRSILLSYRGVEKL